MGAVSDGERRAASGLRNQYGVGAALIIEALRQHDFEWTRIADPEAGRVDDIQIARTARLDAYQVKWQQYPGSFTFNDLIKPSKKSPSLIEQLADGWNKLKVQYPNRRIAVHLVTDAFSSPSTGILPKTEVHPSPYHFAAFIDQAWKPAKRNQKIDFEGAWSAVWQKLQVASGLEEEVFSLFVWDCSLDFRTPNPPENEDCLSLESLLFKIAASGERKVEFNRNELLSRLGWQSRYDYRNSHEFDVPLFYRPIGSTVSTLKERFTIHDGGYIGLIGSPGSGKSTLLTRTLRELAVRLIRYYAYVPEAQDPTVLRGESINFLHDITLRLEEAGFGQTGQRPDSVDRPALLKKLHEQLQALGSDYEATGQKTLILIDGLDHIAREQQPERSLLSDLPLPSQIPKGVYIVLGSQTTDINTFPPLVRHEVNQSDRRVEIGKLSPSDVDAIAIDVLPELEAKERYRLFELSAGHPLALSYLINQLKPIDDVEARAAILAEAITYADDIDAYYCSHWDQIQDDDELIHILGLLSRVRGAIAMEWAIQWIERSAVRTIDRIFKPYFAIDAVNRWSFFHNSFRLFLQNRTCQPILGQSPDEISNSFHVELANLYDSAETPWRWEALYHLYRANNYSDVVALSTTAWFQSQVKSLRPLGSIQTDVRLAMRSAGKTQDSLALVQLTLVLSSLDQRQYTLNDYAFADLFLDLEDVYLALEFIRDGDSLKVSKGKALSLSIRLATMGYVQEGERLFELAEPYSLLAGNQDVYNPGAMQTSHDLLGAWAEAAARFRTTTDVISVIESLEIQPDPLLRENHEQVIVSIQQEMGICAAIGCAKQQAWDEWKEYMNWIASKGDGCVFIALLKSVQIASKADLERAQELLQKLLKYFEPSMIRSDSLKGIENRVAVAELSLLLNEDRESVTAWIESLPDLPLQSDSYGERGLRQDVRFRLYRLKYWLKECGDPSILVGRCAELTEWRESVRKDEKAGFRRLAFVTMTIAALWGRGKRGQKLSATAFLNAVRSVLDQLKNLFRVPVVWHVETSVNRPNLAGFLIQAAAQYGEDVLISLANELEGRWQAGEWSISLRRAAIAEIARVGNLEMARQLFLKLDDELKKEGTPDNRAEWHWEQANVWLELQDTNAVRKELSQMVVDCRGLLNDHDYQSAGWVRWMSRANQEDSGSAMHRTTTMLRRLVAADGASGIRDAAEELIAATFRWSPRCAAPIAKVFQENNTLSHYDALSSLLRGALSHKNPPITAVVHTIANLLIPLSSPSEDNLIGDLIEQAAVNYGEDKAISIARYLVKRVRVESLTADRQTWLRGIAAGLERISVPATTVGIELSEIVTQEDKDDQLSRETLHLLDGTRMQLAEVYQIVQSASDFEDLAKKEDSEQHKYFCWGGVARRAAAHLNSSAAIVEMAEVAESKLEQHEFSRLLSCLSDRALSLGLKDLANTYANQAVSRSEAIGWDRYYDGGARIEAVQALQKANSKNSKAATIKLYSEDIGGSFRAPQRLLPYFEEITPLLFDSVPSIKIWEILEDYLDDLYISTPVEPLLDVEQQLSLISADLSINDTATQGIMDAIVMYLDHPSYVVTAYGVRAATAIMKDCPEDVEIKVSLTQALTRSDTAAESVLAVLDSISTDGTDVLESFSQSLSDLSESSNLLLRVAAAKLVARMEDIPTNLLRIQGDLPAVYSLELPEISRHRTERLRGGDVEPPVVINDPAQVLRPLDIEARMLAVCAGVDEGAVMIRAIQLLSEMVCDHFWIEGGRISVQRLNRFLESTGLYVSHYKPHIEPTQRAIAHVAAELWDAGRLRVEEAQEILVNVCHHDSGLVLQEPEAKPSWLVHIETDSQSTYAVPENWIEGVSEGTTHLQQQTPEGKIILGEHSRLAYLSTQQERIEETRTSHIAMGGESELWDEDNIEKELPPFYQVIRSSAAAYSRLQVPFEKTIIGNYSPGIHTPAAQWIALNPQLARELNWQLSPNGHFRWIDGKGNVAVESIWWKDGSLERYDPRQYCKIGEGWLVLATEDAYKCLVEYASQVARGGLVRRTKGWTASGGSRYLRTLLPLVSI